MKLRNSFGLLTLIAATLINSGTAYAELPIKVCTTLSSYADISKTIGGDRVEVSFIASPRFNPHFIEARPSDVLKIKRADLFIHSGLDLEAWRGPLLDAVAKSEFREGGARQVDLSEGISLLEVPAGQVSRAEGDIHMFGNPHYWPDPRNGLIIAKHIAAKLSEVDPVGVSEYSKNLKLFIDALNAKIQGWSEALKPYAGKVVIGYHNEWPYLMSFAGLSMTQFVEPKPGIPAGPQHLAELEAFIKSNSVKALVQASYFPKEASEYLHGKTGITVLALCQNVGERPECGDYISMLDFNLTQLIGALRS